MRVRSSDVRCPPSNDDLFSRVVALSKTMSPSSCVLLIHDRYLKRKNVAKKKRKPEMCVWSILSCAYPQSYALLCSGQKPSAAEPRPRAPARSRPASAPAPQPSLQPGPRRWGPGPARSGSPSRPSSQHTALSAVCESPPPPSSPQRRRLQLAQLQRHAWSRGYFRA